MRRDAAAAIMDEDCDETVVLADSTGAEFEFVQVALIPYDGDMYAVLADKEGYDTGAEDCAMVVKVDGQNVDEVTDEALSAMIFELYDNLYDEADD